MTLPETDAAKVFRLRCALGLSQADFSERFGIPEETMRNLEQGRFATTATMRLVLAAIEIDPALMERAAATLRGGAW